MREEKETRKNLMESAGALYFFFRDKEDLFGTIVEPPLEELKVLLLVHFNAERELLPPSMTYHHIEGDHNDFSAALVHHIYTNRSAFILLLVLTDHAKEVDYEFIVEGICDYSAGLSIFMDIDSMREIFGKEEGYYNMILSDEPLDLGWKYYVYCPRCPNLYTTLKNFDGCDLSKNCCKCCLRA